MICMDHCAIRLAGNFRFSPDAAETTKNMMRIPITHINRFFALVLLGLSLGACSTYYKPVDEAFHKVLSEPYTLDSGDRLRITVFDQRELTNTYAVEKGGHISMPLIGSVPARGRTIKQLENSIAAGLRNGYIRNPDVSVEVDRYRPFYIMGEVGNAGQYVYVPGMTVQNAIAIAGGYTARAEQANADITRAVDGNVLTGRVPISDPILPGDTIYVRERLY